MLRFKTICFDLNQMTTSLQSNLILLRLDGSSSPFANIKMIFSNILLTSKALAVCSARRLAFTIKVLYAGEITWQ